MCKKVLQNRKRFTIIGSHLATTPATGEIEMGKITEADIIAHRQHAARNWHNATWWGYIKSEVSEAIDFAIASMDIDASDCELANEESRAFHAKFGFQEVNRIVCFKKELGLKQS